MCNIRKLITKANVWEPITDLRTRSVSAVSYRECLGPHGLSFPTLEVTAILNFFLIPFFKIVLTQIYIFFVLSLIIFPFIGFSKFAQAVFCYKVYLQIFIHFKENIQAS